MQKWELREGQHVVGMTFDDYAGMVLRTRTRPVSGSIPSGRTSASSAR